MFKNTAAILVIALVAGILSGCWEDTDVTLHEPGAYKGAADPLLAQDSGARAKLLDERFNLVQMDR